AEMLRQQEARRARLAAEFRRAEEERKKKEVAKQAARNQKRSDRDDDYVDGRLPVWKKGMMAAASVLLMWWTGSAALGWFFDPERTGIPRTPVTGTAVLAKSGESLVGAWIGFHSKDKGGDESGGFVNKEGKF